MPRTGRPRTGGTVPCATCGKPVYRHPSTMGRRYCTLACRAKAQRAKRINEAEGTAKCAKCKTWKPIAEFVGGERGRPHSYCKPCGAEWFAKRRGTPPEKRRPYRPAYRLTEEEKRQNKRDANRRQHVRRRGAGDLPDKWAIGRLYCRQDARCAYCGAALRDGYHIDHKTPVSRGGGNEVENLQLTCPRCNMRKSNLTHEEFLVSKRRPTTRWDSEREEIVPK